MYKNLPGELGEGVRVALYVIKCFTSKNQYGSTFFRMLSKMVLSKNGGKDTIYIKRYWKCNYHMTQSVCRLVGRLAGWSACLS